MEDFTGTTACGVVYRDGIILGCEKRTSNESSRVPRGSNWHLRISDSEYKHIIWSDQLVSVKMGSSCWCTSLERYLSLKVPSILRCPDVVSRTAEMVKDYMEKYPNSYGLLIGGYDTFKGYNLHMELTHEVEDSQGNTTFTVLREESKRFIAGASGRKHALDILISEYDENMSGQEAKALVKRAVFNGTFYSKCSGGNICTYDISSNGVDTDELDIIETYKEFYACYKESLVFFLLSNASDQELSSNDISGFGSDCGEIMASHRVAKLKLGDKGMCYFYRLVFSEARGAAAFEAKHCCSPNVSNSPRALLLQKFNFRIIIAGVRVLLEKASRQLLNHISDCERIDN